MNRFIHQLRAICSVLVVLALAAGFAPARASAQEGDSYSFESNDKELVWASPWENDPSTNSNESDVELVGLFSIDAFMIIGTVPAVLPLEDGRDVIVDSFADGLIDDLSNIDEGAYDNFSYSFDEGTIDGTEFGIFTLFRGGEGDVPTELQVFFGVSSDFAAGFASAQEDVTWDGDQLFNGVDGQGLEDQLGQAGGDGSSADDGSGADDGAEEEETPAAEDEEGSDDPIGDVKNRAGNDDNEGDDGSNQTSNDAEAYLDEVESQSDVWTSDLERLLEILSDEDLGDPDIAEEFTNILNGFLDAPSVAEGTEVPDGMEDVQAAYEDYANALAEIPVTFSAFLETEPDTTASDNALDDFTASLEDASAASATLEEAISAAR